MSASQPRSRDPFTVHRADARQVGKLLDSSLGDRRLTASITSPPYFNLLDYGGVLNQVGHGQSYVSYLSDCRNIFEQLHDRTADDGSLWLIADTLLDQSVRPSRLRNLPFDLSDECEAVGWTLRDIIIWHKDKTRPWSSPGRLRNAFEYILFFVKSENFKYHIDRVREPTDLASWWVQYPERYNPRGKAPENVWRFPIPAQGSWANTSVRHSCPLPPDLVERMMLISTDEGDVVCDPFAGSGTVIAEAKRLGRRGIGTELNAEYARAYRDVVLKEIVGRSRATDHSAQAEESRRLQETITKLRAVKLAKATWHALRKTRPELPLPSHVVAIASSARRSRSAHHTQDVALTFVLDEPVEVCETVQAAIKELLNAPPLTKYGISGDVKVSSADDAEQVFQDAKLWLYEHGHTWKHSGRTDVSALVRLPTSDRPMRYPPIASNVSVSVSLTHHRVRIDSVQHPRGT